MTEQAPLTRAGLVIGGTGMIDIAGSRVYICSDFLGT
jgi:hypothetical protein